MGNCRIGRRIACLSTMLLATACGSGGGGDGTAPEPAAFVVEQVLPARGAVVSPDLADAGGPEDAGRITLVFSDAFDPTSFLDPTNLENGLSENLEILDADGAIVRGTPMITDSDAGSRTLKFQPAGGTLAAGPYAITVTRGVRSEDGRALNRGESDFLSSFTVGPDLYPPHLRSTWPVPGQEEVPKDLTMVLRFDEPLDPATVNESTVKVWYENGEAPRLYAWGDGYEESYNSVGLENGGFDIVFSGFLAPNAHVFVRVEGGPDGVRDLAGHAFEGSGGNPWFEFRFETMLEPSPPPPCGWTVSPNPVVAAPATGAVYFGSESDVGVFLEQRYLPDRTDLTRWFIGGWLLAGSGRVGEILVDPRFHPVTGDSWYYVADVEHGEIHVRFSYYTDVEVHTWTRLPDPTGLARAPDGSALYVTNSAANTVSVLDIGRLVPGTAKPPAGIELLDAAEERVDVPVGRGPRGIAHERGGGHLLLVANRLDDTISVIDDRTLAVVDTIDVGDEPFEIATTPEEPGLGAFAFVSCRGGDSVGVLRRRDDAYELIATVPGFAAPEALAYDGVRGVWVANAGGRTVAHLTLDVAGDGPATTVTPRIAESVDVGGAPTGVAMEPWVSYQSAGAAPPACLIVAVPGRDEVVFIDAADPTRPTYRRAVPGVREVASYLDE